MTSAAPNVRYSTAFSLPLKTKPFHAVSPKQKPLTDGSTHSHRPRTPLPITASAISRRQLLVNLSALAGASLVGTVFSPPARATNGLRIFPLLEPLSNSYYLMRACETVSDKLNLVNTNPVNKLSLNLHGLTATGVDQALSASSALSEAGVGSGAWIWPSVTISSYETAEIVASKLRVRREQIVPEFSFLDMRGVGAMEGGKSAEVRRELVSHDRTDSFWRPPPGEDGTPNDSTEDVFVRVRQLLSKLETQYFAEDIIILSPDSDPLSVLQAAMTGHDLRLHHDFEYSPGEVRFVRELVVDTFGNTVVEPLVKEISRPLV